MGRRRVAALVDGRGKRADGYEDGSFASPTIHDHGPPGGEIARTEIFGPMLSLIHIRRRHARRGDRDD